LLGILMAAKYACRGLVEVDLSQLIVIFQIGDLVVSQKKRVSLGSMFQQGWAIAPSRPFESSVLLKFLY